MKGKYYYGLEYEIKNAYVLPNSRVRILKKKKKYIAVTIQKYVRFVSTIKFYIDLKLC